MDELVATPSSRPDDATLVALLRTRPAAGVALLYDTYGRLVYSVALRIVGDHGLAEEITQDVFVRCWSSIGRFEASRGSLATWMLTIAHHRAVDELRSRRNRERRRELPDEQLAWMAAPDPALDDALLRGEIQAALGGLPEAQREVIQLVYWGGLTRREVAEQLSIPLGTVHTRLRLGMEKLRGLVDRMFGEGETPER